MSNLNFGSLKVTTMTLILPLIGMVNLNAAATLLPITRIELPPSKRINQKYKIPHCSIPGSILSIRFRTVIRGIIKSNKGSFKNSITIDVACKDKNLNIKLSGSKIQLCGATSTEMGKEGAQYILNHLLAIQDEIDHINSNKENARKALDWIKNVMKGPQVNKVTKIYKSMNIVDPITQDIVGVKKYIAQVFEEEDNSINRELPDIPDDIDPQIVSFLLRQHSDYYYYSDLMKELEWILTIDRVITRPLEIEDVYMAMVNYNYDIGYNIDRFELHQRINGLNGFKSTYDNSSVHYVKVELPYEDPNRKLKKKGDIPCHTFLIYKSGLVTQSGPGSKLMEDAFYSFMDTLEQIKPYVMKVTPRTLRYVPYYAITAPS